MICGFSLNYSHFSTNVCLLYSLKYCLWTFIHNQSFQDHSTVSHRLFQQDLPNENSTTHISRNYQCSILHSFTAFIMSLRSNIYGHTAQVTCIIYCTYVHVVSSYLFTVYHCTLKVFLKKGEVLPP